jgi:hypothetical protein
MQFQDIIQPLAIHTQDTINRNVQETCKLNEECAIQDHERWLTNRVA